MDRGRCSKRREEAWQDGDSSAKRQSVTLGLETLDCTVCSEPLKPPIFQCSLGHFLCLSCRCEILDKKCHICSVETSFERCFGMEHVVKSVTVPCCNAKYGCTEQVTYYLKEEHEMVCPNAPCFCPESGCSFAGPTMALLSHLTAQHKCPFSTFLDSGRVNVCLYLDLGLFVLRCREEGQFFLFNIASEPFGHAVSVICVQPKATEPKFTCALYYNNSAADSNQSSCCDIQSSSLSEGLPKGYDLIVPKGKVSDEGDGIFLRVVIREKRKVSDEGDGIFLRVVIREKRKVSFGSDSDGEQTLAARRIPVHPYSDDDQPLAARPLAAGARRIPDHSDSDDDQPVAARPLAARARRIPDLSDSDDYQPLVVRVTSMHYGR